MQAPSKSPGIGLVASRQRVGDGQNGGENGCDRKHETVHDTLLGSAGCPDRLAGI